MKIKHSITFHTTHVAYTGNMMKEQGIYSWIMGRKKKKKAQAKRIKNVIKIINGIINSQVLVKTHYNTSFGDIKMYHGEWTR